MKLVALTSALVASASTAFAGSVSLSSQSMAIEEAGPMGGSMQWLIPLIAIALIFLVGNGEKCDGKCEFKR